MLVLSIKVKRRQWRRTQARIGSHENERERASCGCSLAFSWLLRLFFDPVSGIFDLLTGGFGGILCRLGRSIGRAFHFLSGVVNF